MRVDVIHSIPLTQALYGSGNLQLAIDQKLYTQPFVLDQIFVFYYLVMTLVVVTYSS